MVQPYEQDVILDVAGQPIYDAMTIVQRRIDQFATSLKTIGKDTVADVKQIQTIVDANIKALRQARADLKTLQEGGGVRGTDYGKAEKDANRQRLIEAKTYYGQRAQLDREAASIEKQIAKEIADYEASQDRASIARAKEVAAARREAALAAVTAKARGITNVDDAREAKVASDARLANLRREREATASNDAAAARGIADRIALEKSLGRELDNVGRKLAAQKAATEARQTGGDLKTRLALAASDVRNTVNSGADASTVLIGEQFQRELQLAELRKAQAAGDYEAQQVARENLRIAEARVTAAQRLVQQEENTLRVERQIADANARGETKANVSLARPFATQQVADLGIDAARAEAKTRVAAAEEKVAAATNATRNAALSDLEVERARLRAVENIGNEQAAANRRTLAGRAQTAIQNTALYGLVAGVGFGAFNAAQQEITDVVALEDELAKLQGISNSTDTEMQSLKASILGIGETSRFAVNDLVKIAQTLAQAGVSAADMTKVLQAVTTLATASGSTPDEAVQLVTSALGAFQLQASEAARVADLMTEALNRTKLTVTQVGQAIQYVGATAYEQNISLETLLATIGAVAQGGVKSGSTIGTGFRQFLVDLQTPSEKLEFELKKLGITQDDVNIKTRGLAAVLDTLKEKGFGAVQAYDGLETRAAAFYLVAKNNTDVMDELQLSFAQQGAAAIANERSMNSLTAQWTRFKNVVEEDVAGDLEGPMTVLKNLLEQITDRMIKARQAAEDIKAQNANGTAAWYNTDISKPTEDFLQKLLDGGYNNGVGGIAQKLQLGTWLRNLDKDAKNTSASMEVYADSLKHASDEVDKHGQIITEVDKEMERLKGQQSSLINNTTRSQAETVTLTARFEGLVKYLGTTKNAYLDLINAMGQYRGEESRLLSSSYFGQVAVQQKQNNLDQNSLNSTVAAIKADPNLMAKLTPQEKSALNNPNDLNFPRRMAEAADRIGAAADKLNDAATYSSRLAIGRREVERDKQQGGQALAASTGLGQQVTEKSQDFSTRLDALSTLTQGDRTKAGGALTNDINSFIGQLNARLPATSGAGKQFVQDAINTLRGLLNQVAAAIKPSQEEIKQAKADAAEQRRQEAELRKRPLIQQSDIDSVGQALGLTLGRGNDSSPAAKARENALHARGLTPATGDTSAHTITGGVARDFGVQGLSDAQANRMAATIRAQLQAMGIDALVQFETGVGKNQGTGRHIHVSVRPGTRFSKDKTDQQADAYDADLSAAQTTLDQSDLTKKLKDVSKATTTGTFNAAVQAATDALTKVNADIKNQALDELAAKGFGPNSPQYQARMQQVDQEIAQNVADFQQKIADNINKSVEKQLTAADRAFELATSSANANLKLAQGQVTGLDAYSLRNKVPDYTKQLAQDRAAQAQEALDRATQAALPARIASVQGALTSAQDKLGTLTDPTAIASVNDEITKLTTQLKDLQATKDALDAQLGADGLIPKTWTDAINQAATAFEHANGASNTFAQDLQMSLGGALQNVSDGLATMFTNILDGSQTALQAFGNFAKGIIQYMLQIVAKAAATKILSLLFNLVGIGAAGAGGSGGWSTASGSIGGGGGAVMTFEGGRIGDPDLPIERLKGGEVTNGSPTADSVRTKLAMGEWVVQKKAVDSVGNQFMARLNQHGAKALDTLGSMPSIDMKNHTETNVYVVPPEQKPTLSKNDVLVIMNDDMMNGDSKRLIQHIAKDS